MLPETKAKLWRSAVDGPEPPRNPWADAAVLVALVVIGWSVVFGLAMAVGRCG